MGKGMNQSRGRRLSTRRRRTEASIVDEREEPETGRDTKALYRPGMRPCGVRCGWERGFWRGRAAED
jgi:hypothetical protein